jgi:hypothetical protein
MQDVLAVAHNDGVTGVGAALEPGYDIEVGREMIHHLPLSLVSPLETDDRRVAHGVILLLEGSSFNRMSREHRRTLQISVARERVICILLLYSGFTPGYELTMDRL